MTDIVRTLVVTVFLALVLVGAAAALLDLSWITPLAMLAGWYLADALSGIVHMTMDYRPCPTGRGLEKLYRYEGSRESADYLNLLRGTMAKVGPLDRLTYDFKNHHPRPDALGRRSLWRQIGSTVIIGALPLSLALDLGWWLFDLPGWLMAGATTFIIGGALSQYFHGTLHRADNPWIVRAMRRVGLLMTPAAHQLHHDTLRRDFSTNCGWSNPVVNALFTAGLGWGLLNAEGLEPRD